MKKIFILLPHKDQFIKSYSGSASIWVKDFLVNTKFKKNITVFGSTNLLNEIINKKIYKNILIPSVKFRSRTNIYIKKFISEIKKENPKIIEIHNRPSYLTELYKKFDKINYILIVHNDPLNLEGSSSIKQRINLLNICKQIYFVSSWVEEKFFEGIEKNYYSNFKTIYPSINQVNKFPKKENLIIFSGKLNAAKGFDKFCIAMKKILNKHVNWKAFAIGDEPRENIKINHPNFLFTGWIQHEKVLKIYNKSSITVVPSSWEEPFGRSSLEAGSRGNAVIISRKGGLPETIGSPIILDKITHDCIFHEVNSLINKKNKLINIQKNNFNNPLHLIKDNIKTIDEDRNKILNPIKKFNINKNSKLKILHVFNRAEKIGGRIYFISTGKKLENGLIRLGHDVEGLSDRDIINYNPITGKDILNKTLFEKSMYYRPDLVLIGHVHNIYDETYEKIKHINKNVIISQWYEDNLTINGPDFKKNFSSLKTNFKNIDNFFISTHPDEVSAKAKNVNYHFLPTPVDRNIEKLSIYNNKSFIYDVFFAMSHGVNRGNIKSGKIDEREVFIKKILELNKDIKFDIYGFKKRNPVWSENFYKAISRSSMAININRGKSKKYSSSNRIASLMGNGLLTFMDNKKQFDHFFNKDEMIFFDSNLDLTDKLNFYKNKTDERKKIARNGQKKYFKLFNCEDVAKYIVNKSIDPNKNYKPNWE
jgi:glycosyltransferase involved in cell wall biosynthesis